LPRPEEVEEDFDDIYAENKPICNQIENYCNKYNIPLEKGWKVRLAAMVKKEIFKGNDKVISESDKEFEIVLKLFEKLNS
jgi:hypothetical protein